MENEIANEIAYDIDHIFTYHQPSESDLEKYKNIREAGKEFFKIILKNTPYSQDQSHALRLIRETVMIANASIALNGRLTTLPNNGDWCMEKRGNSEVEIIKLNGLVKMVLPGTNDVIDYDGRFDNNCLEKIAHLEEGQSTFIEV